MDSHVVTSLRPAIAGLEDSLIRRVSDSAMGKPGLIALWFGESDDPTPTFINAAAKAALDAGYTFYTPNRGVPALRTALSDYMTRLHSFAIAEDRISVTASAMSAIMLTMQALVEAGDNVIVPTPLWPNCAGAVEVMGGEARRVAMGLADDRWSLDLDRVLDACDARTRAVFINSPGNPTGWVMGVDEQRALLQACRARGLFIVADEVYDRIVYDAPRAPSFLDVAEPEDRVVVINSFSKSWSMTGWRLGWLTHASGLGDTFAMLNEYNLAGPATIVQHAGIAALEHGEAYTADIVARYRRNRDLVYQRFAAMPRVRLALPEGAFYAFFQVDGMGDSEAAAYDIIERANVGLAPGRAFGPAGEGFLRLCFAARTPTLSEALDRLTPVLS